MTGNVMRNATKENNLRISLFILRKINSVS